MAELSIDGHHIAHISDDMARNLIELGRGDPRSKVLFCEMELGQPQQRAAFSEPRLYAPYTEQDIRITMQCRFVVRSPPLVLPIERARGDG